MSQFADELYDRLAPLAHADEENGYPLRTFVRALAAPFEEVEVLAREDLTGGVAWSQLLDVDRSPTEASLRWLAQLAGVGHTLKRGLAEQELRDQIKDAESRERGTSEAMIRAIKRTLTDTQFVWFRERWPESGDPPYQITVVTRTSQTPRPDLTAEAITYTKPAGIVMTWVIAEGETWDEASADWNDAGLTWLEVVSGGV